jgi:hypothetical protein
MRIRHSATLAVAAMLLATLDAQIPVKPENLQYFPKDITRDALIARMRQFSFALGVRCQYCHAGGNGVSFEGVVFASDEKDPKRKARQMLRMVDDINAKLLPAVPARVQPPVAVDCVTCHRGSAVPRTIDQVLRLIVDKEGADAAAARYRELRRDATAGRYSFTEWTMNEFASDLDRAGKTDAAITILLMNAEFYPASADIDVLLGELHAKKGDKAQAIARFKTALEKAPEHPRAKARLAELSKG